MIQFSEFANAASDRARIPSLLWSCSVSGPYLPFCAVIFFWDFAEMRLDR
jgi:hypothetical protein